MTEVMQVKTQYITLGDVAEGEIGGTLETHRRLDEFTDRVGSGEFHTATRIGVPCGCIDGRCGCRIRPDAAGGTLTLAVADDLLEQRYTGDGTTADMVRNVFRSLRERGFDIGDHTADTVRGEENSSCGANDLLGMIYRIIVYKRDVIRTLARVFGVAPGSADHEAIIDGANRRMLFSTGREVLDAMTEGAGRENIDVLRGDHHEVLSVINHRRATTLDRDVVVREFGDEYEAFNIDVWSFAEGARALYPDASEEKIQSAVTAMAYYNIATALALCGPSMRIVVMRPEEDAERTAKVI